MSNQQRFIVTEDPWLGGFSIYDRKMHKFMHGGSETQSHLIRQTCESHEIVPWRTLWFEGHPEGKPREPYLQIKDMFD